MKVYLTSSLLLSLLSSSRKQKIQKLLLEALDSHQRFFTSSLSIYILFQQLGDIEVTKKTQILGFLEDLTDTIFELDTESLRTQILMSETCDLEMAIALKEGMEEVFVDLEREINSLPLLVVRNFFGETK
ncbi:hypothetical protein [Leptospira meyeri]|uniref:Uncharacterized protein n=1 Tax=Leptospira meyeri TaxID=29508 RepID=A0A4R8MKW1_LEPME|nr:hypothetical protein [Leptospira meyeri]PKA25612.1 hypothetical protein CH381_14605 [Leptospira sp. mixed culture ATI2-C-A1]EKJ88409.1 hypothetical protein LEP1GSC017_0604 [Leptospira meyeri serovar Hardjo str. Went 5]EMJ90267.1 hypothetical protein LEP1GSC196_2816 [Leptospira meyeri serovar Semaranga str. Veldrot Semarang 173]MCW7487299.1 hypothetical protein [Leptospira meyeri]TDY67836.1 hypothetical protein CLV96_3390 [Leptospira meyeri]